MIWMPQAAGPGGWTLEDLQAAWEPLYEIEQVRDWFRARRCDSGIRPGEWFTAGTVARLAPLVAEDNETRLEHQRTTS